MPQKEERVFTSSPLPPVLHGFRLGYAKKAGSSQAIPGDHASGTE
ncbi:hypothetical protein [Methanolobus chelungpuianus]|nr:hypothetical protein [Methanolobus chelungpuianus]